MKLLFSPGQVASGGGSRVPRPPHSGGDREDPACGGRSSWEETHLLRPIALLVQMIRAGHRIRKLDQIQSGGNYVAGGQEAFKKLK